jgi:hypothetical protein
LTCCAALCHESNVHFILLVKMPDILGGAALGIFMVILFQRLPLPPVVYRLLDWERCASPSFYTVVFIVSYQVGTLFDDIRAIARLIELGR